MSNTTIKNRRGTEALTQTTRAKVAEPLVISDTYRAFIGDGINLQGFPLLNNDVSSPGEATYYGSNQFGTRGFHSIKDFFEFTPNTMQTGGSASVTTAFSSVVDIVSMADSANSSVTIVFPFSKFWSRSKNIHFKVTYTLNGDATEERKVTLDSSVWIVDQNTEPSSGSPDYTYTDYMVSRTSMNIDKVDSRYLTNAIIPSAELSGTTDQKYLVLKLQRTGGDSDDTYTGSFRLINILVGQIENGESFGYAVGGLRIVGADTFNSSVHRIMFPFDYGDMEVVGNLNGSKRGAAACNSSRALYISGGGTSVALAGIGPFLTTIEKLSFPFDSGTTTSFGNLINNNITPASFNSSTYGYVLGGEEYNSGTNYLSSITRFNFQFESAVTAVKTGNLNFARVNCDGLNSSQHGFVVSGFNINLNNGSGGLHQFTHSYIERIEFPFDSGTGVTVGTLTAENESGDTVGTFSCGTCNSSTHGYTLGGQALSSVSRITFPFDATSTSTTLGNLSSSKSGVAGFNSGQFGYAVGGRNVGPERDFTQVDRIQFPFDSGNSVVVGNVAGSTDSWSDMAGGDGTDFSLIFV